MHGIELVVLEFFAAIREDRLVPGCNADPGPAGEEPGIAVTRALERFLGDGLSAHNQPKVRDRPFGQHARSPGQAASPLQSPSTTAGLDNTATSVVFRLPA